jgi:hypothetical protein
MNAKTNSMKDGSPEPPTNKTEMPETPAAAFTMLLHRNVERLAGLQKATLDTLNHQTADIAETMRTSCKPGLDAPAAVLLDLSKHGMEAWTNAQKDLLDLIVQQSAHVADATNERSGYASQSAAKLNDLFQQTVERASAAQKTVLDFAAAQNRAFVQAFQRHGVGVMGSPLADMAESIERGVATSINMQKEFLDSATKMARSAATGKS